MIDNEDWLEWKQIPATIEYIQLVKENMQSALMALHGCETLDTYRYNDGYYTCLLDLVEEFHKLGT
jgi:hypothetical protein